MLHKRPRPIVFARAILGVICGGFLLPLAMPASAQAPLPRLKVADNKRFLVTADGQAVLLAGRHRLGAVPPAEPRGGGPLPAEPRRAALHRHPGGRAGRARRPERRRTRTATRPLDEQRSGPAERGVLRARRLDRGARQRARALRRHAADLGRQVEQEVGRRPGDLHAGERRGLRRVAGPRYKDAGIDLDSRRRSAGRNDSAPRHHARDGARPARGATAARTSSPFIPPAAAARRPGSTTTTGSTSTCARTATSPSSPAATT